MNPNINTQENIYQKLGLLFQIRNKTQQIDLKLKWNKFFYKSASIL